MGRKKTKVDDLYKNRSREEVAMLVEKNLPLVDFTIERYLGRTKEIERRMDEIRSEGVSGLLQAASEWDPEKGAFSTLAVECIKHAIWRYTNLKRNGFVPRAEGRVFGGPAFVSLDDPWCNRTQYGQDITIGEVIPDYDELDKLDGIIDKVDAELLYEDMKEYFDTLTGTRKDICEGLMSGLNSSSIAENLGVSRQCIDQTIKLIREDAKDYYMMRHCCVVLDKNDLPEKPAYEPTIAEMFGILPPGLSTKIRNACNCGELKVRRSIYWPLNLKGYKALIVDKPAKGRVMHKLYVKAMSDAERREFEQKRIEIETLFENGDIL